MPSKSTTSRGGSSGVLDPNGDSAAYAYDAEGNLLSITRKTASQVSIIDGDPGHRSGGNSGDDLWRQFQRHTGAEHRQVQRHHGTGSASIF
jgi:YD repeat-containing protein